MAIKKKTAINGKIIWESTFFTNGRGSKFVRRRFSKKIDAQEFVDNYGSQVEINETKTSIRSEKNVLITFSGEAEFWLKQKALTSSSKEYRRTKDIVEKLYPLVGNVSILNFKPTFLYNLRSQLIGPDGLKGKKGKIKNSSINRWFSVIRAIINFSYHNQRIDKNPSVGFKMLKENSSEIGFWNMDEAKTFLNYVDNKYKSKNKRWIYVVYLLSLNTGLRAGEIWGLKQNDLAHNGVIKISRQWLEKDKEFAVTKGNKTRLVPMNTELKFELNNINTANDVKKIFKTIFCSKSGYPVIHTNFRSRYFMKDVKESGVSEIRFHDLRHTCIRHFKNESLGTVENT